MCQGDISTFYRLAGNTNLMLALFAGMESVSCAYMASCQAGKYMLYSIVLGGLINGYIGHAIAAAFLRGKLLTFAQIARESVSLKVKAEASVTKSYPSIYKTINFFMCLAAAGFVGMSFAGPCKNTGECKGFEVDPGTTTTTAAPRVLGALEHDFDEAEGIGRKSPSDQLWNFVNRVLQSTIGSDDNIEHDLADGTSTLDARQQRSLFSSDQHFAAVHGIDSIIEYEKSYVPLTQQSSKLPGHARDCGGGGASCKKDGLDSSLDEEVRRSLRGSMQDGKRRPSLFAHRQLFSGATQGGPGCTAPPFLIVFDGCNFPKSGKIAKFDSGFIAFILMFMAYQGQASKKKITVMPPYFNPDAEAKGAGKSSWDNLVGWMAPP